MYVSISVYNHTYTHKHTHTHTPIHTTRTHTHTHTHKVVEAATDTVVVRLHKPREVITTSRDPSARKTVYHLLPNHWQQLRAVGRLDYMTEVLCVCMYVCVCMCVYTYVCVSDWLTGVYD
jgi:16S rRNA U516 pseudouridylate synthase RsuA-like enzyme